MPAPTMLLLIVSVGPGAVATGAYARLLASLEYACDHLPVHLYVGNRTSSTIPQPHVQLLSYHELQLPSNSCLSAGRNALLTAAADRAVPLTECLVNFPDDDSWFLPGSDAIGLAVAGLDSADVVMGCYAPGLERVDRKRFGPVAAHIDAKAACLLANSVSMFWPGAALRTVGSFDERLGAGTRLRSSEDLDVLLRGLAAGLRINYLPDLIIGHEYGPGKKDDYYVGNIAAIRKNAPNLSTLWRCLARRLLGGLRSAGAGRLAPATLGSALRIAVTGLRQGNV